MRILLIEDQKEISKFLKPGLESENFIVDTAEDGVNGSFLARTNGYDLILLDYMLPKANGRQVIKEIREDGKNTPIIIITVRSEVNNKVDLLNIGADDYITKPFSFEELIARINAVLRRPREIEKEIIKADDLILNTESHVAKRGGKKIHLTRKEFMLLEYMVKNKNKVLSRGMIMEHVWDINADPFSNTIESHILNIRKKIDNNSKKKIIQTISGRGYKINTEN